jgi:dienelactone hydrolase
MSKSHLQSSVRICVLSSCLALAAPLVAYGQYTISDEDAIAAAKKFAKLIVNQKFDKAAKLTADDKPTEFAKKLKDDFEKSVQSLGKFKSFGEPEVEEMGERKLVSLPSYFENGFLNLTILVNYQEEIIWIKYQSLTIQKDAKQTAAAGPAAQAMETEEKEVTFGKEPWQVKGKLMLPKSKKAVPAVVLVHGWGPRDADETIGPNKPFEELAKGLSGQGVAVLRFPNRLFAYKDQMSKLKTATAREEIVEDVLEALKFLRQEKGIDKSKLYILGFDFGATITPQIAKEDGEVAGVILLAAPARNSADVFEERLKYLASLTGPQQAVSRKQYEDSKAMLAQLRDGSAPATGKLLGQPIPRWMERNEISLNSPKILAELQCRILVAGAGRDYHVARADFDVYKTALKGQSNAKFKWYKALNHYFMRGEGKAMPQEYDAATPFDSVVIQQLAKWIKSKEGAKE